MKTLLAILLCCDLAFGATEVRRPSTDGDTGSATWVTNNCGIATYASNGTSGGLAYDSAGQATSVTYARAGTFLASMVTSRTFSGWTNSSLTYTALRLNINSFSAGTDPNSAGGEACLVYSLDNGTTWTAIRCSDGWTRTTDTVNLSASQNLSKIRVGVCVLGVEGTRSPGGPPDGGETITSPGNESVQLFDIWTAGDYSGAPGGNGSSSGQANRSQVIFF